MSVGKVNRTTHLMQYQTGSREQCGLGILLVPVLAAASEAGPCAGTDVVSTHTVGAPTACARVSGQSGHNKMFSPTRSPQNLGLRVPTLYP